MSLRYDEVWSVPAHRVEEFFNNRDCLGCTVSVSSLPDRRLGSLSYPQTEVILEGEHAEELYRAFFLNFLSGGA